MPTILNDKTLRNTLAEARKSSQRIVLRDAAEPGLKLVCGPRGGVWTFSTTTRQDGVRRESFATIGRVEDVSLAVARIEARKLKADLRSGVDRAAERKLAKARATTLAAEVEKWNPKGSVRHARNDVSSARLALVEMGIADAAPEKLTRRDLLRLLALHEGRPATARARLGALRRLYDHLVNLEIVETNPVRGLPFGTQPAPPTPRDSYPTASEAQRLWRATEGFNPDYRDLMRLLMLCPLRRTEGTRLLVSEVDLERREIRLPAKRMKARSAFVMPLSRKAFDLLAARVAGREPDEPVFGAVAVDWWRLLIKWRHVAEVKQFGLHDLRRLFMTEATEHHVGDEHVIDALLAHAASATRFGTKRAYQHAKRAGAKREIMEEWSRILLHAIETGRWPREDEADAKVVDLRATRRA
jgi:integrase